MTNQTLAAAHADYIKRHLKSGGRVLSYLCPACEEPIQTPAPLDQGDVWNSPVQCPHCENLHTKNVNYGYARGA